MDIKNKKVELDEQVDLFENENTVPDEAPDADGELKIAIGETLSKIRRQSMLLGGQTICRLILDKIIAFESKPGSKSNNDHKRLIKDIKHFVEIGLSRKVNADGETESVEETAQN